MVAPLSVRYEKGTHHSVSLSRLVGFFISVAFKANRCWVTTIFGPFCSTLIYGYLRGVSEEEVAIQEAKVPHLVCPVVHDGGYINILIESLCSLSYRLP